jgi:hypothetical protein
MLAKKESYAAAITTPRAWPVFSLVIQFPVLKFISHVLNSARYNFPPDQVLLLTDADAKYRLPTRKEMFSAFTWLVEGAQRNDSLFFHCTFQLPSQSFLI